MENTQFEEKYIVPRMHHLKLQSLSLDYRLLMLILLNHYMLIEFVWYLHDTKWLGSQ